MKWILKTRIGLYLLYVITYGLFWKIAGFEFTVIIILTTILGEIHYQYDNPKKP